MIQNKIGGMNRRHRHEKFFYYSIVALPILQFCIFYIGVNFNSILLSMQNITMDSSGKGYIYDWVWFDNFARAIDLLFHEYSLLQSFKNSMLAYFVGLIFGTGLTLFFSYYIYKKSFLSGVFKIVLFLPSIISSVAMVLMFKYFTEKAYPVFVESVFGKTVEGLISNPDTQFVTILVYSIWIGFGGGVLMYVGAMNSISESIVEAAYLDGITPLKEFFWITLPMIYPTLVTFIVTGLAGIFTNQMNLYTFKGGSLSYSDYTYGYYLFVNTSLGKTYYPQVAAIGILFTIIIAPITFLVRWLLEKFGPSVE